MTNPTIEQGEKKEAPSREEIITWYKEQIELQKLRYTLTKLQSKTMIYKAEELKAMAFIAQFEENNLKPEPKQQES